MPAMRRHTVTALIVLAASLAACSAPPRSGSSARTAGADHAGPPPSGFLSDYASLRPSPRHPQTLYFQSPRLAEYTRFMIDPVTVLAGRTKDGEPIDPATAARLGADLREQIADALGIGHEVTDHPDRGVARIRAGITAIGCTRTTADGSVEFGCAAVEAEITDSLTGERLGAVVEHDAVDAADVGEGERSAAADRFYGARLVFRHWAARLVRWLDGARTGDIPPTR